MWVDGPVGPLQTRVEDNDTASPYFALVCHPHPLMGGSMDNKVVTTLSRSFQALDIPSLRFNFRGVGASAGTFDAGAGETDDAEAVAAWGTLRWPDRDLVLAGFSFGAYIALRLAQRRQAHRLITVAPPVQMFDFTTLRSPSCPWLVIQGDADDIVDAEDVKRWCETRDPVPRLAMMPGAGHFFHGRLKELRDTVVAAIRGG